jgi:hypothetical protein
MSSCLPSSWNGGLRPIHSEPEFIAFIFPHLSMPRRGPQWKLGYHCFNRILRVHYKGMRWKCLPVHRAAIIRLFTEDSQNDLIMPHLIRRSIRAFNSTLRWSCSMRSLKYIDERSFVPVGGCPPDPISGASVSSPPDLGIYP